MRQKVVEKEQREFRANPLTLKRLRLQFGLNVESFCKKASLDKGTAQKLLRGDPVYLRTIVQAAKVFSITNHHELLHPNELLALGVELDAGAALGQVHEWLTDAFLTLWEMTTNNLQYRIVRLRHRLLKDRLARGKCYELKGLTVPERKNLEERLRRHPEVCERVGRHPNIAENLDATFVEKEGLWWVIDSWEEGESLANRLKNGPLEISHLKTVMLGVAEGLHALHKEGIIRRELSPRFILLRQEDHSPILTDFELAKLIEGKRTVRPEGDWPDDPYLALEAKGEAPVDARADVYSWGRVFAHAATGKLPPPGDESAALHSVTLPPNVLTLLEAALSKNRNNRPSDMAEILKAMKRWRVRA